MTVSGPSHVPHGHCLPRPSRMFVSSVPNPLSLSFSRFSYLSALRLSITFRLSSPWPRLACILHWSRRRVNSTNQLVRFPAHSRARPPTPVSRVLARPVPGPLRVAFHARPAFCLPPQDPNPCTFTARRCHRGAYGDRQDRTPQPEATELLHCRSKNVLGIDTGHNANRRRGVLPDGLI